MSEDCRIPEDRMLQDERSDAEIEEELRRTQALLRTLFRERYYLYHADELIPDSPPDFSFMDDPAVGKEEAAITEEQRNPDDQEKPKVVRRHSPGRALRIAAALFLCFLLGGGTYFLTDSPVAHAARFHLEKIMYQVSGLYYTSDDNPEDREDSITIRVDSLDDIDKAVRFMPELFVPSYVPEGWELDSLELRKTVKGIKTAQYIFNDNASRTFIIDEEVLSNDIDSSNYLDSNSVKLTNREVFLLKDDYTGLKGINFIENNVFITLSGELEEGIMIRVADNMIQPASHLNSDSVEND